MDTDGSGIGQESYRGNLGNGPHNNKYTWNKECLFKVSGCKTWDGHFSEDMIMDWIGQAEFEANMMCI